MDLLVINSKTYDSVEWDFLEGVILKIRLDEGLVSAIMKCVRFVSFFVLIMGYLQMCLCLPGSSLRGSVITIFVLVIRREVERGVLHRARIYRRVPMVSKLFFTYDTLIFGRATREELRKVKEILEVYEGPSA